MRQRRLYRSNTEKMLFGVAGGLAEYFEIDPTVVRVLFVLAALLNGVGIVLYLALAIIMPKRPPAGTSSGDASAPPGAGTTEPEPESPPAQQETSQPGLTSEESQSPQGNNGQQASFALLGLSALLLLVAPFAWPAHVLGFWTWPFVFGGFIGPHLDGVGSLWPVSSWGLAVLASLAALVWLRRHGANQS